MKRMRRCFTVSQSCQHFENEHFPSKLNDVYVYVYVYDEFVNQDASCFDVPCVDVLLQ